MAAFQLHTNRYMAISQTRHSREKSGMKLGEVHVSIYMYLVSGASHVFQEAGLRDYLKLLVVVSTCARNRGVTISVQEWSYMYMYHCLSHL